MKFGIFILGEKPPQLSGAEVYQRNLEQAKVADELGFDNVWLAEHHFSPYGTIADPFVFAGAVAAATTNIRIGTAVVIPSFMNPIRLAERVAMVDLLSNGRFDLGLGRGYQRHEFERFGIPMEESRDRFVESIDVLEGLLGNESYSWEGRFSSGQDIQLFPRPIQRPIPIYIAVLRTVATIEWVVSRGYHAMVGNPYIADPELSASLELLKTAHGQQNRDHKDTEIWALTSAFTSTDPVMAREYPRASIELNLQFLREYAAPFHRGEQVPDGYAAYSDWFETVDRPHLDGYERMVDMDVTLIGEPELLVEKMTRMNHDHGWQNFMLTINRGGSMDQAEVLRSMELFATDILPQVRANRVTADSETLR